MIRTKQLQLVGLNPKWVYGSLDRGYQVGDKVEFTCNGKGRGGHYRVFAVVDKVNKKTMNLTELPGSYIPGTRWQLRMDTSNISIYVELPSAVPASLSACSAPAAAA